MQKNDQVICNHAYITSLKKNLHLCPHDIIKKVALCGSFAPHSPKLSYWQNARRTKQVQYNLHKKNTVGLLTLVLKVLLNKSTKIISLHKSAILCFFYSIKTV